MENPRQLIYFPPRLLERASREVQSAENSFERLNDLVVEALGQYLDELEAAEAIAETREGRRVVAESRRAPRVPGTPVPEDLLGFQDLEPPLRQLFSRVDDEIHAFTEDLDTISSRPKSERQPDSEDLARRILDWTSSKLPAGTQPDLIHDEGEVPLPDPEEPVFGLHNRDYPSLWALGLLAEATADGPVPFSQFASGLELLARSMGGMLRQLDYLHADAAKVGLKHATAFPKKEDGGSRGTQWLPSSDGSRQVRLYPFVKNNFARIQHGTRSGGGKGAVGPAPAWRAIGFEPHGKDYKVGLTRAGLDLLGRVEGVSLSLPHSADRARAFLSYLAEQAPGDREGFEKVLGEIAKGPNRTDLVAANRNYFNSFIEKKPGEEDNRYAGTMTQGYVSRGREWGLVSPELTRSEGEKQGIYSLTETGELFVQGLRSRET